MSFYHVHNTFVRGSVKIKLVYGRRLNTNIIHKTYFPAKLKCTTCEIFNGEIGQQSSKGLTLTLFDKD